MQSVTYNNFSGGIADSYLSVPANKSAKLHNFWLDENGLPFVRFGLEIYGTRLPGSTRISGLYLGSEPYGYPVAFSEDSAHSLDADGVWNEILGPGNNVAIPNKTSANLESLVEWRKQLVYASAPSTVLPHRIYCTSLGPPATFRALTLGLPSLGSSPSLGSTGGTGNNYTYSFHYYYSFTDYDGTTFEESGPVTTVSVTNVGEPSSNQLNITSIPVLANTSSTNYDVSTSLKIKIYRNVTDGSTQYLLATISNGTTSYADTTSDATLQTSSTIYTDGGIVENTQPPVGARYCTEVNDFFWFATDRKIVHSIQGSPGACPAEYEFYPDQKIQALHTVNSFPILFCDQSVYRVDGVFDEFGDGGYDLREISQTAGCISHRSIVPIDGGLVWAGNGGFYFTNGNSVQKISIGLDDSYKTWANSSICGTFDPIRNMVFWAVNSSSNSGVESANDVVACLHLNFGIKPDAVFTTLGSSNNVYPTAMAFSQAADVLSTFRKRVLIGDNYGHVLYFTENAYTDPKINTNLYPSEMKKSAIVYRYESSGVNLGTDADRKYCSVVTFKFKNETDAAIRFQSRRDDGGAWGDFSDIRSDGAVLWNISECDWDDAGDTLTHDWNSQPIIEGKRHFPAGSLRGTRRQIAITNARVWIAKSDDSTTAQIGQSGQLSRRVELESASYYWPEDCEDYEIAFDNDSYATFYKIKNRESATIIEVYDPYATLQYGTGLKWQIRGIRKFERIYLLSYTVNFDMEGDGHEPNRGTSDYVNA